MATNFIALSKLCDLVWANTCVAKVVYGLVYMRSIEFVSELPLVVGLGIRGGGNQCYSSKVSCVTCLWQILVWLKLLTGLFTLKVHQSSRW